MGALSRWRSNTAHVQICCYYLLANLITDPNGICELMDSSATVFVEEFSNFFSKLIFNWHSTGLETWMPFKNRCPARRMLFKSFANHLKSFHSGFTELHAKLDEHALLDFAINRWQNETRSRKSTRVETMRVHSAVSRGRLMQQACGSVTLVSHLLSQRQSQD
jgi:hypothetical protein